MQQLILGFFLGVYVGTKYDLSGDGASAEEYASRALRDMEKRKRQPPECPDPQERQKEGTAPAAPGPGWWVWR